VTVLAVNQELVLLYWGIGNEILARQKEDGWETRGILRFGARLELVKMNLLGGVSEICDFSTLG
jgi:hypothetical protein